MNALLSLAPQAVYDRLVPSVGEIMAPDVLGLEPATRLVEIVTERDILRAVATGAIDGSVGDAMTHGPDTIGPEESAGHAAALMIHGGFRHLPVVDGGDVVGMLSIRDLVRVSVDDEAPRGV